MLQCWSTFLDVALGSMHWLLKILILPVSIWVLILWSPTHKIMIKWSLQIKGQRTYVFGTSLLKQLFMAICTIYGLRTECSFISRLNEFTITKDHYDYIHVFFMNYLKDTGTKFSVCVENGSKSYIYMLISRIQNFNWLDIRLTNVCLTTRMDQREYLRKW